MPRGVDSEEDYESKGGRRTRATTLATAPLTPVRRSARNRHGSVNPDGSSPESIADSVSSNSKINTRRRAANVEPAKATRSGRNTRRASVEAVDSDHAPGTPTVRTTRRSIAVVTPAERPKPTTRNTNEDSSTSYDISRFFLSAFSRRVKRTSDSESSPPHARVTRRMRAMSAEPEFTAQSNLPTSHEGTPTKTRRGRALALPKEPAVVEEVEEVKSRQSVIEVSDDSEDSMKDHSSARLSTIESSPKNMSRTGHISDSNVDVEDDDKDDLKAKESPGKSSKNSVPLTEKSSDDDSLMTQKSMSPVLESEPSKISIKRRSKDFSTIDSENENVKISTPKSPIVSKSSEVDNSKEVGVRIEDLLNKSIEKQKSPGNKENEKVNPSSEKVKKNLEFDISPARVIISRRSSNSTPLTEKYSKSKLNNSLDEQVLSENSLLRASAVSIDGDNIKSRRSKTLDKKPVEETTTPDTDTEISVTLPSRSSTSSGQVASDFDKDKSDNCFVKLEKLAIDNETSEDFILYDSTESPEPVSKAIAGKKNLRQVDDNKIDRLQSSSDEEASSGSGPSKTKLSEDENSPEQRTSGKNKSADDKDDEEKSTSKPRRSSLKSQHSDTPNKPENKDVKTGSVFDSPPTEQTDNEKEKNVVNFATPKKDGEHVDEEAKSAKKHTAEIYKPESPADSVASSKSREEQLVTKNIDKKEKAEEKSPSPKAKKSKKHASLRISDAESDTVIDGLFQDISADEWVSKYKNCSLADADLEFQKSGGKASPSKSMSGDTSISDSESCADRHFGEITNSVASEKGRKSNQMIVEIQDSDEEVVVESTDDTPSKRRKSLNKSAKLTASPAQRDKSQINLSDVEDDSAKFSTDASNDEQKTNGKSLPVKDTEVEEKPKTPKNFETKLSEKKSTEKSRKSLSMIRHNDEDEFVDVDSTKKSKIKTPASDKKQKQKNTPVSYLTLDVVDTDSLSDVVTDDDYSPSAEHSKIMPSFLFNVNSSDSEDSEKSDADNSINSDIAREMNLAGDSIVAYSDDDVPGDDCRASESEHSDEDDDGLDLIDFVVDDDEAESSAESEPSANEGVNERTTKNSYKRLLNVFTSDEEEPDEKTGEKSANATAETTAEEEDIEEDEEEVEKQITQNNKDKSNVTDDAEAEAEEEASTKDGNNEVEEEKECEGVESEDEESAEVEEEEDAECAEVEEEEDEEYEKVEEEDEEKDDVEAEAEDEEAREESNRLPNPLKTPRRSLGETDSSKLQSSTKKSKRSLELDKSQSPKSAKKHKYAKDTTPVAPLLDNLPKSMKKLKKLHKSLDKFDSVIDITTPDHYPSTPLDSKAAVTSVPSKDISSSKKNKLKKLRESYANMDATIDLTTPDPATPKAVGSKSAPVTPAPGKQLINSKKKLKKLRESYAKADATIGSEASDEDVGYLSVSKLASVRELSRPNTSIDTSSGKKKRKSVSQDDAEVFDVSMRLHNESNASSKHDPKVKTPKSASKTNNDTTRRPLTYETPRNVSKLNKTVMTPNSETPQTKFLKKERLNESLPLMELNSRKKTFTKSVLLHDMNENDGEDVDSDGNENGDVSKKSEDKRDEAKDESFDNEDEVFGNGSQDDEDKNGQDDRSNDENDEEKDQQEIEIEPEEEDEELSEDETKSKKKKKETLAENVAEPDDHASKKKPKKKKKKSRKAKNVDVSSEPLVKKKGDKRKADLLDDDEIVPADTYITSKSRTKFATTTSNGKDNSSETIESKSEIVQKSKKSRNMSASESGEGAKKKAKQQKIAEEDSDSDDAPESLDFVKAREDALTTMKNIAANLKVSMEAKKKKRRDQLEKIRLEKEEKLKKLTTQGKSKPESGKITLKRLPEDVLEHLSDTVDQPQKRRKLLKGEEIIVPSKSMFSSDKVLKTRIKVDNTTGSISSSGGTTQFNVVSIERVKKEPKKAVAVASFRDRMLARNPRQAVSAYNVYQAKQKASGKDVFARRKK